MTRLHTWRSTRILLRAMSLYKPSPLSYGSPRTSPFRRPESPASPSTVLRPTTPTSPTKQPLSSPAKPFTPITSPTKLANATASPLSNTSNWSNPRANLTPRREAPASPSRTSTSRGASADREVLTSSLKQVPLNHDPLLKLPTAKIRELREAFEILDRDNDGQVTRDDVIEMLTNLGLPSDPSSIGPFFPPSSSTIMPLSSFLTHLSSLLTPLSPSTELISAFAAFDDDDSGQIDVKELRDALLHTTQLEPGERALSVEEVEMVLGGFTGRRAFGGGKALGSTKGRGDVFRYREFVGSVMEAGEGGKGKAGEEK